MNHVALRNAHPGDEKLLAYIQTESWKAAFHEILTPEDLARYTDIARTEEMYTRILRQPSVHISIEFVENEAHCIAAWSASRGNLGENVAELICIHSLQRKWHKGYGSIMMRAVLSEMKQLGYSEVVLWVFAQNTSARRFYGKHGFQLTEQTQNSFGAVEVMYARKL